MTTWILWISKDYPIHWERALEHGFWDMLKERDVRAGDDVYFWQGGSRSRVLGWTRATSDARPLRPGERGPWVDAATAPYLRRFQFNLVSDEPRRSPKWGEVAAATGLTSAPMSGLVWTRDSAVEEWFRTLFDNMPTRVDLRFDDDLQIELEDLLEDTRERAARTIALRRGQGEFRAALLEAYQSRCAVTGCSTVEVLEAAHISPHLGTHTNVVANGLLLRADVHTLFDLHLITVTTDFRLRVSPKLAGTPYMEHDDRPLASLPTSAERRPASSALESHHASCPWYEAEPVRLF